MKVWLHGFPTIGATAEAAVRAEQDGFAGLLLADSEVLVADPYIELALASVRTSRLGLGLGVTNPLTRHPAVTAAAILTLHAESGGRAVLGFARGDSALRRIGLEPASVADFGDALARVRSLLGSGPVVDGSPPLAWAPPGLAPLPVDVAATGPAMIRLGAVHADRLTLNLGADPERLRWGIALARQAREAAGLDPQALSIGAYVDMACAEDDGRALDLVRGSASIFVAFLAEGLRSGVPANDADRAVAEAVAGGYSETDHGLRSAPQSGASVLPDAFLARYALAGRPETLLARTRELASLGLDRLVVVPASRDVDAATVRAGIDAYASAVLPALG